MGNTSTNVVQEYDEDDFNMEYIRGGVLTSIPNEVKQRPKIGRNPKTASKSNSKIKNESLRSALSVDLDNPEAERIRKEFEMFRLSKENDLANFKRKEKKLETENRKLKTELQALQKTCKKLRDERDYALDAEQRALMRAASIEMDRDKTQRQFKIFRESKESELQNLLKVKRILESKIMKVDPSLLEVNCQKDDEPSDSWTVADSIVGFYPPRSKDDEPREGRSHGDRWLDDKTPQKLDRGDLLRNCSDVVTVCWIPCRSDLGLTESNLFQANLERCCKIGDHLLNFLRIPSPEGSVDQGEVVTLATSVFAMATSSYFLGAVFSGFSAANPQNMKMVEGLMSLKVPLNIFICSADHCDGHDDDDDDVDSDDNNDENSLASSLVSWNELYPSTSVSIHHTFRDLCCHLEKAIEQRLRSKHRDCELDCLNVMGWENIWRWQDWQDQLFHDQLARFHSTPHRLLHHHGDVLDHHHHQQHQEHSLNDRCFEFSWLDKYLMKVTNHASSPGPVPPLLVEGAECSGKTTLLMRWIDQYRERSPPSLVLSYSVVDQSHPSGDPSVLLKCLMFQIMRCFSTPFALVLDPGQLVRDFPKWLEKVSTMFPGGVVLVLDSVDRVKNFEVIFDWLMDPLPVDLRVIVSLRNDACPPSWRSWPLLSIDPMTENEVREYVDLLARDSSSKFNKDVALAHLLDNPSLCLPPAAQLVSVLSRLGSDAAEVLPTCRTVRDLYGAILLATEEQLSSNLKESFRELLGLICCSRQGMTLSELLEVTGRSEFSECKVMVELVEMVVKRGLLRTLCGLIMVKNDEVKSSINDWSSEDCRGVDGGHDDNPLFLAMNEILLKYHLSKLSNRQVTPRRVAELAWVSWRQQDWDKLRSIVSDLELCMTFLERGLGSDLVDYWRSLNYDLVTVSSKLKQKLQEYEQSLDNSKESQSLLSSSYELVGKFLAEQGLHEEALEILQRCEEFQGHDFLSLLKVGRVSNLLGHIHDKLGRRGVAETMYLTALSHFEGIMDATSGQKDNNHVGNEDNDDDDVDKDTIMNESHKVEKLQQSDYRDDDISRANDDDNDDGDDDDDQDDGDDVMHEYRYHNLVAAQLDLLASLHSKQGRAEMSDNFLKRAANLRSRTNGRRVNNGVGQVPSTESIRQRIEELNSSKRSGDLDDLSLAGVEHELGVLHALLGHYREAEAFLNGSLVKRESLLPSNHISVVQSLNSLVALYGQLKQLNKVEELSEKLVQLVQKMTGHDSILVLGTMRNLIHVNRLVGRMDKTERYLEILLNLLKENPSTRPYDFATALVNLAVVCSQQGKHSTAEPLYKRALNTFRSVLPPDHPRITETVKNLALSKYEQGDFEEAARLYLLTVKGN